MANERFERQGAEVRQDHDSCPYRPCAFGKDPVFLLGYAQLTEPAIPAGVRELAAAVQHSRR